MRGKSFCTVSHVMQVSEQFSMYAEVSEFFWWLGKINGNF